MAAGLVSGTLAGWWTMRDVRPVRLEGNRVLVRGELVSLLAILMIFACRFAAGTLSATGSSLNDVPGVVELFIALPVFLAALMAARALAQAGHNPLAVNRPPLTGDARC